MKTFYLRRTEDRSGISGVGGITTKEIVVVLVIIFLCMGGLVYNCHLMNKVLEEPEAQKDMKQLSDKLKHEYNTWVNNRE